MDSFENPRSSQKKEKVERRNPKEIQQSLQTLKNSIEASEDNPEFLARLESAALWVRSRLNEKPSTTRRTFNVEELKQRDSLLTFIRDRSFSKEQMPKVYETMYSLIE